MTTYYARFISDVAYDADKPLKPAQLVKMSKNQDMYTHVAAHEGIDEIKVRFEEPYRHHEAHHHDGISGCRSCRPLWSDERPAF